MKNFLKILLMSFVSSFSINPLYAFDLFSIEEVVEITNAGQENEQRNYVETKIFGISLS